MRIIIATLVLATGIVAALSLAWLAGSWTAPTGAGGPSAAAGAGNLPAALAASSEGDAAAAPEPDQGPPAPREPDPDWPPDFAPMPGEIVAPATRNVTPPGFTSAPTVDGPLVRVEGLRPDPKPQVRPKPRKERLFRVQALDAGRLQTAGGVIRLAGISVPDLDGECGADGATWPCGRMARTALQRLIRGRAIECDVPFHADEVPDVATCSVAGTDLSAWLVENGWAKTEEQHYADAAEAAKEAGLGIWGATRP